VDHRYSQLIANDIGMWAWPDDFLRLQNNRLRQDSVAERQCSGAVQHADPRPSSAFGNDEAISRSCQGNSPPPEGAGCEPGAACAAIGHSGERAETGNGTRQSAGVRGRADGDPG
jgi:hypothetical protein